jgi:DNA-directed RNA polymerase subunit RPC12/RpoP
MSKSKYICARCGNPVGLWHYGWKHQAGGKSQPSCKQPVPMLRDEYEQRELKALDTALRSK